MLLKESIKSIKDLCDEEVKCIRIYPRKNMVDIMLPFSKIKICIEIEGKTVEEQVGDFIEKVNLELREMENHLSDCEL